MKYHKNYSKTAETRRLRDSTLEMVERPLAVRFSLFCLEKKKLLKDMGRYSWIFCRAYEAQRLHLRLEWNAMGMFLDHEPC